MQYSSWATAAKMKLPPLKSLFEKKVHFKWENQDPQTTGSSRSATGPISHSVIKKCDHLVTMLLHQPGPQLKLPS